MAAAAEAGEVAKAVQEARVTARAAEAGVKMGREQAAGGAEKAVTAVEEVRVVAMHVRVAVAWRRWDTHIPHSRSHHPSTLRWQRTCTHTLPSRRSSGRSKWRRSGVHFAGGGHASAEVPSAAQQVVWRRL